MQFLFFVHADFSISAYILLILCVHTLQNIKFYANTFPFDVVLEALGPVRRITNWLFPIFTNHIFSEVVILLKEMAIVQKGSIPDILLLLYQVAK